MSEPTPQAVSVPGINATAENAPSPRMGTDSFRHDLPVQSMLVGHSFPRIFISVPTDRKVPAGPAAIPSNSVQVLGSGYQVACHFVPVQQKTAAVLVPASELRLPVASTSRGPAIATPESATPGVATGTTYHRPPVKCRASGGTLSGFGAT